MAANEQIESLSRQAEQAHQRGALAEAMDLHRRILTINPDTLASLEYLGMIVFQQGQVDEGIGLLRRTIEVEPERAASHRNLATALVRVGRLDEGLESFRTALRHEPSDGLALLMLGTLYDAMKRTDAAEAAYSLALENEPGLRRLPEEAPPRMRQDVARAAKLARDREARIHDSLVRKLRSKHGQTAVKRFDDMVELKFGRKNLVYADELQRPFETYFPGLTPRAWFDREEFDWARAIEADFPSLQEEFASLATEADDLRPYIKHDPGDEALRELHGSYDWSALHLFTGGRRNDAVCSRYPRTVALLEQAPMLHCAERGPEAFFSILKPRTRIAPHYGQTNYKLTVHLPIVVPADCGIKVGEESRTWQPGKLLVFDDSFLHEAWNNSDEIRIILLFNVWNPGLTDVEKEGIQEMYADISAWRRSRRELIQ